MFKVFPNKGFQMTFKNGWTVSVMFGSGNYCEMKYDIYWTSENGVKAKRSHESKDAEIAAWDFDGNWFDFGCDTVDGYISADEVGEFINKIKEM